MRYRVVSGTDVFGVSYTTFIGMTVSGFVKYKTMCGIFRKRLTEKTMISILTSLPFAEPTFTIDILMKALKESGRVNKEYEVRSYPWP